MLPLIPESVLVLAAEPPRFTEVLPRLPVACRLVRYLPWSVQPTGQVVNLLADMLDVNVAAALAPASGDEAAMGGAASMACSVLEVGYG